MAGDAGDSAAPPALAASLKKPMRGWAIYELYRKQAEELERTKSSGLGSVGADLSRGDLADEDPDLAFDEENRRFARMTEGRRPTGNEVAEHEARLLALVQRR